MSLGIVPAPPCAITVVAPCITLYETRVPPGMVVLPRFETVGLDADLRELLGDEVRDRRDHRGRRRRHAVRADGGDADRSLVPAVRVSALGVVAALAACPHVAVLVDEVAVADVAPAPR